MAQKLTIEQLREKQAKKENELRRIRFQVEEIEEKKELPKLKKKYEGKYFKYNNGTNHQVRWWLYCHCKEVNNVHRFVCDTFETTPYQHEFRINDKSGIHLFQQRITKREFDIAAKKFLRTANKLIFK